jgi:hypothetical protein
MHGMADVGNHRAGTQVRQSQSHLAHRTCRTISYMPSDISYFGDMLLSTIGFHRRVSRCPGGLLLSTSSLYERNFACTDTAHKVVPLVLCRGDGRGEDHPRKVLKHGNDVHRSGVWEKVLFDVSHVTTPELMTPHRFKRHIQFGTWLPVRLLKSVELPVRGHDATTRRGADLDAHAQERGMDTVLSQQGILLEFADLVSHRKRRFAYTLVTLWLRI